MRIYIHFSIYDRMEVCKMIASIMLNILSICLDNFRKSRWYHANRVPLPKSV